MTLNKDNEETQLWPVWINWEHRVVSFLEAEGFERLEYPSHDEMLWFVIGKGNEGFGIQ